MVIDRSTFPFRLSDDFVAILVDEIAQAGADTAVTLNFRDPGYSAEEGGYHPVEVRIEKGGGIAYITDFAFVGMPPYAELVKEIDFDVSLGLFQHFGREFPLECGRELFGIWQENFVSYYRSEVYRVTVTPG